MKNTAIICGTPYQAYNALNMIYNDQNNSSIDVFFFDRFELAKTLSDNFKNVSKVNKTILLKDYKKDEVFGRTLKGIIKNIHSAWIYLRPKKSIKAYFNSETEWKYVLMDDRYERILAPTPSFFLQCLEKINSNAVLDYYEDGMGSYSGDFNKDFASTGRKFFSKIFKVGYNVIPVSSLFIYRPEICTSTVAGTMKKLPSPCSDFSNMAAKVFDVRTDYKPVSEGVLWFGEFHYRDIDLQIINIIRECGHKVTIRMHPKSKDREEYIKLGLPFDDEKMMWEISISGNDFSGVTLIGSHSTAMITPKLLYNIEPIIVMTYKLYHFADNRYLSRIEAFADQIKALYSDSSRVFIPSGIDELRDIFKNLNRTDK